MTIMKGETPAIGVGGPAYDAAFNSVEGKQWTEALLNSPLVTENILDGFAGGEVSTKAPGQLAAELDEQLGELRPKAGQAVKIAFEGVNAYLTRRGYSVRMMRLCNTALAIGAVQAAEGVEVSDGQHASFRGLDSLIQFYSQKL